MQFSPSFSYLGGTNIDSDLQKSLLARLNRASARQAARGEGCVEVCFRELELAFRLLAEQERREDAGSVASDSGGEAAVLGEEANARVPYPRTSGARFCPNGQLVVFKIGMDDPVVSEKIATV